MSGFLMDLNFFKREVIRVYSSLYSGGEAWCQNSTDIAGWEEDGHITKEEAKELRKLNDELEKIY